MTNPDDTRLARRNINRLQRTLAPTAQLDRLRNKHFSNKFDIPPPPSTAGRKPDSVAVFVILRAGSIPQPRRLTAQGVSQFGNRAFGGTGRHGIEKKE